MEGIIATMQRKHKNELADLQATVDRLLKVGFHKPQVLLCSQWKSMFSNEKEGKAILPEGSASPVCSWGLNFWER